MRFEDLLMAAIRRSEIPLRFEPGAEEAVARPVIEMLRAWVTAHLPESADSDFDAGFQALGLELLAELDGLENVPQ